MLLHRSLGLERFNDLSRLKAVHALYECCGHYTLSTKLAEIRPFASHEALLASTYEQLAGLSVPSVESERILSRITEMLGPVDGWPEYMP